MADIEQALARKKEQLPQFDYMWRVELPAITSEGMLDPTGAAFLNTASPALNIIGGGSIPALERLKNSANGLITDATNTVNSYAQKTVDFAQQQIAGIPGYSAVTEFLSGSPLDSGIMKSKNAVNSLMKGKSKGSYLSHRVFSVDMPYQSFDILKNTYGSSYFHTASNNEVGSMNIKVDEYEDGDTLRYFEAWRALICNPDGTYNPPASYKRDIRYIKMSSSGLDLHVTIYKGCFPNEIAASSFSYDANSITQYGITLTGDSVEHIFIPANDVIRAVYEEQASIMSGNGYGDGDFFSLDFANIGSAVLTGAINKALDSETANKLANKVKNFFF